MKRKNIVVISGAGISAESGISTFRDAGGLWEGHDIMEVASPQGWQKNMALVLDFYNKRRKQALSVEPNAAHIALADLEKSFDLKIITQNVDNLHEKAGSSHVLHLHGQLFESRSCGKENLIYPCLGDINSGDKCEEGYQLRPNIVWFGEQVPMMSAAVQLVQKANIIIVVGTSLVVYPAASLIDYASKNAHIYVIDPNIPFVEPRANLHLIADKATTGVAKVVKLLMKEIEIIK